MKNILLPTDFSSNSLNAINYALEFFKDEHCTFYLFHVQKTSSYISDDLMAASSHTTIHHSVLNPVKEKLKKLMDDLKIEKPDQNYNFEIVTDYDSFIDAVKQVIRCKNIDLIVMGTNGATGAKEVIFGSNTLNVIRKINCPLITVPYGCSFVPPKNILYSIDYNDHFNEDGIEPLTNILDKYKSTLRILKIKEDDTLTIAEFDDKKHMKEFFKGTDHTFHSITNVPTALAIDSFVQIMDIDLNAMFIHRETFLERFFLGSVTSKISYGSRVPLLVLHAG